MKPINLCNQNHYTYPRNYPFWPLLWSIRSFYFHNQCKFGSVFVDLYQFFLAKLSPHSLIQVTIQYHSKLPLRTNHKSISIVLLFLLELAFEVIVSLIKVF